jgi:hypothetical protein
MTKFGDEAVYMVHGAVKELAAAVVKCSGPVCKIKFKEK